MSYKYKNRKGPIKNWNEKMLQDSRLTRSGNILIISAYLPALVASNVSSLIQVCFSASGFKVYRIAPFPFHKSKWIYFKQKPLKYRGGKKRCTSFQFLHRSSEKKKVFWGAAFEMQFHHADNMEIIISSQIYKTDVRRRRVETRERVSCEDRWSGSLGG